VRDIPDRNVNFKTRITSCRIAVRADIKTSMNPKKKRSHFGGIGTSSEDQQTRIQSYGQAALRFTENRKLKTANSQHRCALRFPYGTGRCNTTGLLEQMP